MLKLLKTDANAAYKHALIAWLILIWTLSSLPAEKLPSIESFNIDKLAHIFVYLILSLLIFINFKLGFFKGLTKHKVLMYSIILASLDESHQILIANRDVSVLDLAANITGLIIGFFIVKET